MKKTKLMGVLNITPDSFFKDSRCNTTEQAINRGKTLVDEGADILDVGGESSNPGAMPISIEEELCRVIPVIQGLRPHLSIPISIDTVKPQVAEAALRAGASLINDIQGFTNPEMADLAAKWNVPICIMHMQGTPQTMQINPIYPKGVVNEILQWFENRIKNLMNLGIKENNIIIDPGIGFGKTVDDNFKIIQNLQKFRSLGFPLLLGVSRKSFLRKFLNKDTKDLLIATVVVNSLAIQSGVDIIRVHDVAAHKDLIDLYPFVTKEN